MDRRSFVRLIALASASGVLDPERLLWVPKPMIVVPAMPMVVVPDLSDLWSRALRDMFLHHNRMIAELSRKGPISLEPGLRFDIPLAVPQR